MPWIPAGSTTITLESVYGGAVYGETLYGDFFSYEVPSYEWIDSPLDIKGITVVFKDFSGFTLYQFSNTGDHFPISRIEFSHNLEKGCSNAEIVMLESPESFGFSLEPAASGVELYFFRSETPFWVGEITDAPAEVSGEKTFSFSAEGYANRFEKVIFDRVITSPVSISWLIDEILSELRPAIPQMRYNADKLKPPVLSVNNLKFEKSTCADALKKAAEICQNYIYGVDEAYEFFFLPKPSEVNPLCVFFSGKTQADIEIKKVNQDKLLNRYYVFKKTEEGNITYVTNGVVNQITSQKIYGLRAEVLTVPDTLSDADAISYAAMLLSYRAFPDFSMSVRGLPALSFSDQLLKPDGRFARVFSKPQYCLILEETFKEILFWSASGSGIGVFAETDNAHMQGGSIRVSATTAALNSEAVFEFAEAKNLTNKILVSFWVKSDRKGSFLSLLAGDDANGYTAYPVYITNTGEWEKIQVNIQSHTALASVRKLKFKITNAAADFTLYLDQLEFFYYGSKAYEAEISEVSYVFQNGEYSLSIEAGSPEIPFVSDFIRVAQKVKIMEAVSKT